MHAASPLVRVSTLERGRMAVEADQARHLAEAARRRRAAGEERLPDQAQRQTQDVAQALVRPPQRHPLLLEVAGTLVDSGFN